MARPLRGGIPREDDWARTPSQPTVLCSTVDQVGSRLLFRGYGVSDSMKPVHAGLIGSDCLVLLDEAHLAEPFRQTLEWVRLYRGQNWREEKAAAPWGIARLTATPGEQQLKDVFSLEDEDRRHPILARRLNASKPARLIASVRQTESAGETGDESGGGREVTRRAAIAIQKIQDALAHFRKAANGTPAPAIGVVVNRVARARAVFSQLRETIGEGNADCLLLIGPSRPVDRDAVAARLAPIRTGAQRTLEKPLVVVATQCIEAGVDIDLDGLITEAAPLDSLRQRFGRLNRAGREITPYAAIIADKTDLAARADDPVYGKAIKAAWDSLTSSASGKRGQQVVEFGVGAFSVPMLPDALSCKEDAPVLLPAHLDLLSQTSPVPAADPEIALWLHGTSRQPDSITVVWRADLMPDKHQNDDVRRLLLLVPPRAAEAIELPLWAVRSWLAKEPRSLEQLADIAVAAPAVSEGGRPVYRWRGNDERSRWIHDSRELRPGDTIVVPVAYGGVDPFGWNPEASEAATDVAGRAAAPFAGRRFAVRVAPGLIGPSVADRLAETLASLVSERWQYVRDALLLLDLPEDVRNDLAALDRANRKASVRAYFDLYGTDDGRPRGVVFVAPFGIAGGQTDEEGRPNATEDDASGSLPGFQLQLPVHSQDVERKAGEFAKAAGLSRARIADLKLAGYLHDAGKVDQRFQAWLHYGDPLGPDPDNVGDVLAKSGRPLPAAARAASGLPEHWRHEALSVRLAPHAARFAEAHDPELVLWLVGSHHGHGRPFFPHYDAADNDVRQLPVVLGLPAQLQPGHGPQSLGYDWNGLDWPSLFARLKARYGVWELARMEAILRLADHRASEDRARENSQ
jgi:CRISPR-associated endonuclease/helicase Cas3